MKKSNGSNKVMIFITTGAVIMVLIIVAMNLDKWLSHFNGTGIFSVKGSEKEMNTVVLNGEKYVKRDDLEIWLLMGLDKFGDSLDSETYYNDQQADFLLMLVFDKENESCSLVQINRDTMCKVNQLGVTGGKYGSVTEQIALSHTYGNGMENSCLNTVDAVSDLLYGVKVDYYISLNMEGIVALIDQLGGVDVTMDHDYTEIDPSFAEGETLHLDGTQSLLLVRSRSSLSDSTNLYRMERQRLFLDAMLDSMDVYQDAPDSFVMDTFKAVNNYMVTNADVDSMESFFEEISTYETSDIITPEGESKKGENFMEFYPDKEKLQEMVAQVFCEKDE